MATSSLTGMLGFNQNADNNEPSAQSGIEQIQKGASNIGQALNQIGSALGPDAGSNIGYGQISMKKGGSVRQYTKGGKINLGACGVSTHQKSKKAPNF